MFLVESDLAFRFISFSSRLFRLCFRYRKCRYIISEKQCSRNYTFWSKGSNCSNSVGSDVTPPLDAITNATTSASFDLTESIHARGKRSFSRQSLSLFLLGLTSTVLLLRITMIFFWLSESKQNIASLVKVVFR